MTETIERDELERAIQADEVTVVETLRDEHFEQEHLPGAIQIHFEAAGKDDWQVVAARVLMLRAVEG